MERADVSAADCAFEDRSRNRLLAPLEGNNEAILAYLGRASRDWYRPASRSVVASSDSTDPTNVPHGGTVAASPSSPVPPLRSESCRSALKLRPIFCRSGARGRARSDGEVPRILAAYAAGYTTQFEPCVENPGVGVMGVHARNEPLMGDQLSIRCGRSCCSMRRGPMAATGSPGRVLRGRVAAQSRHERSGAMNVARPLAPNYEVVASTPQLFGQTFDGPMPGHIPMMPWHWDLHVSIWAHNPSGMFANGIRHFNADESRATRTRRAHANRDTQATRGRNPDDARCHAARGAVPVPARNVRAGCDRCAGRSGGRGGRLTRSRESDARLPRTVPGGVPVSFLARFPRNSSIAIRFTVTARSSGVRCW